MSGRDFDPFGSLGPINPQEPTDPNAPVDSHDEGLGQGFDAAQDPGADHAGDLAPWKPTVGRARSPFTPVPGAFAVHAAGEGLGGAGVADPAAAPVLPAAAASTPVPGAADPEPDRVPEAEAAPELMFLPVAEEQVDFAAAMSQPPEPAVPAEPAAEPAPDADLDSSADPEFEDAAEFLKSLTSELEIDPEGLDDPRWASDPEPAAEPDLAAAPFTAAPVRPEPEAVAIVPVAIVPAAAVSAAVLAGRSGAAAVPGAEPITAADAAREPVSILPASNPSARESGVRRWLPYAAAVAIPLLFGGAVWATSGGQAAPTTTAGDKTVAEQPAPAPADDGPIRILAMGDMLPHDSVNQNALQADGSVSFAPFFSGIQANLEGADAVFCNQEVPSAGVDFGISGYPTFNTYAEFSRDLRQGVGCNLVNLATNHTADKGVGGIAATRGQWDGLDALSVSGANRSADEQNTIQYGEVRGVKTALVSFAEYSNAPIDEVSLNLMGDDVLVEQLLTEARANAQLVIVSAHWGTEDSHDVNEAQRAFAQRVADLGADVVLGTGPHVLQPVEWVPRADGGQTLVWYSLGNMLNTQLGLDQRTGLIASFEVVPGADGGPATVANPSGVLTWMHYDWTAEEEATQQLDARHSLSLQPLAASAELLARTTYGVTVEQVAEQSAAILGPVVTLNPGV